MGLYAQFKYFSRGKNILVGTSAEKESLSNLAISFLHKSRFGSELVLVPIYKYMGYGLVKK